MLHREVTPFPKRLSDDVNPVGIMDHRLHNLNNLALLLQKSTVMHHRSVGIFTKYHTGSLNNQTHSLNVRRVGSPPVSVD